MGPGGRCLLPPSSRCSLPAHPLPGQRSAPHGAQWRSTASHGCTLAPQQPFPGSSLSRLDKVWHMGKASRNIKSILLTGSLFKESSAVYFHKPGQPMVFSLSGLQFPQLLLSEGIQEQDNISPGSSPQGSFHGLQAESKDALKPATHLSLPKDFPGSSHCPCSLPGHREEWLSPTSPSSTH